MTPADANRLQEVQASAVPNTYAVIADVVQLLSAGALADYVLFSGTGIHWLLRWSAIGVIFYAIWRSYAWTMLLAVQASLLLREPGRTELSAGGESFINCLLALLLLAYACSLRTTRGHLGRWLAGVLQNLLDGPAAASVSSPIDSTANGKDAAKASAPARPTQLLALQVLLLAAVALVAMLVFIQLPVSRFGRDQWWQRSVADRFTLWPGPTVITLAVALILLFWQSEWRQLTAAQAHLYLRSTFLSGHYRDLKMILGRSRKAARRRAKSEALVR